LTEEILRAEIDMDKEELSEEQMTEVYQMLMDVNGDLIQVSPKGFL